MHVMQVMAGAAMGGAETYFVNLVCALHRAGLRQTIAIRHDRGRMAMLQSAGLKPHGFAFGGLFDLATTWRLGRLARQEKPDIVVAWMNRAAQKMPRGPYTLCARLGGYYKLRHYRHCSHLVVNTPDLKRYCIEQGRAEDEVHYIPNYGAFNPASPVVRATLDTPDGAPLLLAMGRMHPNKGFDLLLEAMLALPDAYLWLAGEGPERAKLEQLAGRLGLTDRVRFLGWRADREALAAACDVYVVPSRHEPFGNVLLDAWGAGKPLVAAASEGPAAFVEADVSGLLVPKEDPAAMASAIRDILDRPDLARSLGAAGRRQFERDHSEAAVVSKWLDFFTRVRSTSCAE